MCHHRGYPVREGEWERESEELREEDQESEEPEPEAFVEAVPPADDD